MSDILEEARSKNHDLLTNSAPRIPICICVDASFSMLQSGRMKRVNDGIRAFINDTSKDMYAQDSIDLCIIKFGGQSATIVQEFSNVRNIDFKDIEASGGTPLGAAVMYAIDQIEERLKQYQEHGIPSRKPWLIIMSDGMADDHTVVAAAKLLEEQRKGNIKVQCIGLGDEQNLLASFSITKTVEKFDDLKIFNFFEWLSRSASGLSTAMPGEEQSFDFKL